MAKRDIVTIGTSAGGIETLTRLVQLLPERFQASVFVVLHVSADSPGMLPQILQKHSKLPISNARNGEAIRLGHIYIAPPNHHLLLKKGFISLSQGPKENRHRPAIDPMFRSASKVYGNRVIGIVLSGTLDDGSNGLVTIKRRGGVAIVQDPADALFPGMPKNAVRNGDIDLIVPVEEMGAALTKFTSQEVEERGAGMSTSHEEESEKAMGGEEPKTPGKISGKLVPITCPDCGGNIWETEEGKGTLRYQCHVGHAYSPQSLAEGNFDAVEQALWAALRIMQERITYCRDLTSRPEIMGDSVAHYEREARVAEERASLLRKVLHEGDLLNSAESDG